VTRSDAGKLATETEASYRRVQELLRSGMPNTKAAIQAVATETGEPFARINARYYSARKRLAPDTGPKVPRRRAAQAAPTNGGGSVADLLEVAANLLDEAAANTRKAAQDVRALERDALQWRTVAAMLTREGD
jgi:phage tail tape-measure protein